MEGFTRHVELHPDPTVARCIGLMEIVMPMLLGYDAEHSITSDQDQALNEIGMLVVEQEDE